MLEKLSKVFSLSDIMDLRHQSSAICIIIAEAYSLLKSSYIHEKTINLSTFMEIKRS